jgi:serine/threonine protein kinase/WD40 repeat protein
MQMWSITLYGPAGVISAVDTGESQFVIGTETASDVFTVNGDGVTERHAWVWISEAGLQVEDLGGGTLVNGYQITERVQVEYPASVQVGELTLVIAVKAAESAAVSPTPSSLDITIPQRAVTKSKASMEVTIPQRTPTRSNVQKAGSTATSSPQSTPTNKAPLTGEYTLVKEIARGGMGQIYFGEDPQLKRNVAVKVSSVSDGGEDPRFSKEAEVLAQLAHPNIVPIHNIGVDGQGRPFYSMKLVKGRTLQAVLNLIREGDATATKEYPRATLLTIFRKVCDAMMFAHSKGILHRDLKPENIMVGEYGEVLVMDWGLAKVLGEREEQSSSVSRVNDTGDYGMTMEGEVMGTPQYMSPEQAMGMVAELDARSDIYSLGGILYAILTLRPPIDGSTLDEVLTKVKNGRISSMVTKRGGKGPVTVGAPSAMGAEVPEALQAVTLKAMATDRNKRYPSVEAFATDIEAYQNGFATSAEHAGFARQIVLLVKRNKAVSALCAMLLVSAMVFSLRLIASERTARANEQRAVRERAAAQIALAQSADQSRNPQEMRRILDEVPREYRDQHWSYLDAKLAPPSISFEIPEAPIEVVFPTSKGPGCFLAVQSNGEVRYLDPATGFGGPLFRLAGPLKELSLALYEGDGRMWLAVVANRPTQLGEKSYPASLEVLEVPGGASLYKVGLNRPCATVDFSPNGNLLCLGRRPPSPYMLQVMNAHTGEQLWEGGGREAGSAKFSKDENRLVFANDRNGFQRLDSWTGKEQGPIVKAPGRVHQWSADAERIYAGWFFAEKSTLRALNTADGSSVFEHPLNHPLHGNGIVLRDWRLFLVYNPSPSGRVIDLMDAGSGGVKGSAYLLGNFEKFAGHSDGLHFLCLTDKKAVFLRWNYPASAIIGLPELHGKFWFLEDSKLVACAAQANNGKKVFKVFDLAKPKADPGAAFSVWVNSTFGGLANGTSISFNREQSLVSFKDGAKGDECVVARIEPKGIREVSRWKSASTPQLSPSGLKAWSGDALHETATGKLLRKYDRKDSRETVAARWLDENRVLELQAMRKNEEDAPDDLHGNTYVLWEADTGKILSKFQEPRALTFELSPDRRWIAEGDTDGRLRIRSTQTLEVHKNYKVHDMALSNVSWHPAKPVIFTCSHRETIVKAWDTRDGSMVQSFRCWKFPGNISVNPKGNLLGIVSWGGPLFVPVDLSHVRD